MAWTRWIAVAALFSSLALAGSACSSSSSGSTGGGGGGDCAGYASAVCGKLESCSPFLITVNYGTVSDCTSRLTTACQTGSAEPGIGNFSGFISTCSAAYASATCDAVFGGGLPACTPPAGTYANGQACGDDAQCQSLFCNKASGATCGTCAATPKVGDTCTGSCGVALTCSNGTCAAATTKGAVGAACSTTAPCEATLTCSSSVCVKPLAAGQACGSTTAPCDTLAGLTCTGGVCALFQTASAGQPCGIVGTTYILCTAGATCKTPTGSSAGTCQAPADDGQACDATNGPGCKADASCVAGHCTLDSAASCK